MQAPGPKIEDEIHDRRQTSLGFCHEHRTIFQYGAQSALEIRNEVCFPFIQCDRWMIRSAKMPKTDGVKSSWADVRESPPGVVLGNSLKPLEPLGEIDRRLWHLDHPLPAFSNVRFKNQ